MMKSQIRPELAYWCLISKETVKLGETCPFENETVTTLNIKANFNKKQKEL